MKSRRFTQNDIEQLQAKGIRAKEIAPTRRNSALIMKSPPPPPPFPKGQKNIPEIPQKIFLVGIDPDVDRCGFAIKDKSTDTIIEVKALHFFDVINRINRLKLEGHVIAYVDAGWLISKSNWHEAQGKRGERIAKNVGACHQVGKLLCEYFTRKGVKYYAIRPNTAKVSGLAFKGLKAWEGRINQDQRDAVMLILGR